MPLYRCNYTAFFNLAKSTMNIMQVNSHSNYNIGSNYAIKSDTEDTKEKETPHSKDELTPDEERLVAKLEARDAEVKAHEAAHQSGGASTGGATYTYQQGPDGRMYAIGGEVSVSFQTGSTPQETIANAQAVIASALAPADPSAQDMAVASSAMVMMMKARQQLAHESQEQMRGNEVYKDSSKQDTDTTSEPIRLDIPA